jgi:hypothetical protein
MIALTFPFSRETIADLGIIFDPYTIIAVVVTYIVSTSHDISPEITMHTRVHTYTHQYVPKTDEIHVIIFRFSNV